MRILKILAKGMLALIALLCLAVAVARASLPGTACAVTEAQLAALALEKMTYKNVTSALGCDGVLTSSVAYGDAVVVEDYAWQGDAWPYAKFEGHFINRYLHGTSKIWFSLAISANKT